MELTDKCKVAFEKWYIDYTKHKRRESKRTKIQTIETMSRIKLVKTGSKIIKIGIMIFILQNFYFGWNKLPMSEAEEVVDLINKTVLYIGLIIYLIPVFALYEKWIKDLDNTD